MPVSLAPVHYLAALGLAFGLAALLTPLVRRFAIAKGHVAVPKEERWHRRKTALLGGVAIFLAVGLAWSAASLWLGWAAFGRPVLPVMACGAAMFVLGLADDLRQMAPQHKLAGQLVIASALVFFGFRLDWTGFATLNLLLTLLWLVGITNAFNLLDNMDGLAAGVAFLGALFLAVLLLLGPHFPFRDGILLLTACYGGAVLGFLLYNFNPAKIFMGDAGSLFIGFLLACLTVAGNAPSTAERGFVHLVSVIGVPVMILFVPILDTAFVSITRKLFHRRISQGGKDHSSHRMVAIGLTERKAVMVLYAFAAVAGGLAIALNYVGTGMAILLISLYLLLVLFFWVYLGNVKVYSERSILDDADSRRLTPLIFRFTYTKGILVVLLDAGMVAIAYYSGYLLRFEGYVGGNFDFFLRSLPVLIGCQIAAFYVFGAYKTLWGSVSLQDLIVYIKSVTLGTIATMLIILFIYRFAYFSRAVFVIYWVVMIVFVSLSRLSTRLFDEVVKRGRKTGEPALIYGAGVGGQMVVKEIESNDSLNLSVVGFMDDNDRIWGKRVKGYPVLGSLKDLESIVSRHHVAEVIIAFKDLEEEKRREIMRRCETMEAGIRVRQMRIVIA